MDRMMARAARKLAAAVAVRDELRELGVACVVAGGSLAEALHASPGLPEGWTAGPWGAPADVDAGTVAAVCVAHDVAPDELTVAELVALALAARCGATLRWATLTGHADVVAAVGLAASAAAAAALTGAELPEVRAADGVDVEAALAAVLRDRTAEYRAMFEAAGAGSDAAARAVRDDRVASTPEEQELLAGIVYPHLGGRKPTLH